MHGADVGAGGAALPAAGRAGGRRAAGGGRRRLWEERLSSGAVFGFGVAFLPESSSARVGAPRSTTP